MSYETVTSAANVHLKFEDNTTDSNGNVTPTVNGTIAYATGQYDKAAVFNPNGTSGATSVVIPHASLNLQAKDFSIAMWARQDGTGTTDLDYAGIFGKEAANDGTKTDEWAFTLDNAAGYRIVKNNTTITSGIALTTTVLHHIALTYDHSLTAWKIYVDGVEVDSGTNDLSNDDSIYIGRDNRPAGPRTINGIIDDVVVAANTVWSAADVRALYEGPAIAFTSSWTKYGTVFAKPSAMPSDGPYWPAILDCSSISNYPFKWALLCSTDHDATAGGIWLANAHSLQATINVGWKDFTDSHAAGEWSTLAPTATTNPILQYTATGDGDQTETPCLNIVGGTAILTAHNDSGPYDQTTNVFTSSNGVDFAFNSHALTYDPSVDLGTGHTGYFRWGPNPFTAINYDYIGYSLHGGGDQAHLAQWGSDDGIAWTRIAIIDYQAGRIADDQFAGASCAFHHLDINSIRSLGNGYYAAYGTMLTRASGAAALTAKVYLFCLDSVGREVVRKPILVVDNGAASSIDEDQCATPVFLQEGGVDYLFYLAVDGANANVIAVAARTTPATPEALADFEALDPAIPDTLTTTTINLKTTDALDSRLEAYSSGAGVTNAPSANGYETTITTNGSYGGIVYADPIRLTDYDFIELFFTDLDMTAGTGINPMLGFASSKASVITGPYFRANTFGSAAGLVRMTTHDGSVAASVTANYDWGYADTESPKIHDIGMRIWPNLAGGARWVLLTHDGKMEAYEGDISPIDLDADFYPFCVVQRSDASNITRLIGGLSLTLGSYATDDVVIYPSLYNPLYLPLYG